jgi:isocitrate dehydrogenase
LIKIPNLHHQLIKQNMTRITVAKGDGIGPEIMDATLRIIMAGAQLEIDEIEVGEKFIYPAILVSLQKGHY